MSDFATIKSIVSDCVCKAINSCGAMIGAPVLNKLANEYTDKIIASFQKTPKRSCCKAWKVNAGAWEGEWQFCPECGTSFDVSKKEWCNCDKPQQKGWCCCGGEGIKEDPFKDGLLRNCTVCNKYIRPIEPKKDLSMKHPYRRNIEKLTDMPPTWAAMRRLRDKINELVDRENLAGL